MQTLIDDVLAYSKVDMQAIAFQMTEVETALNRALGNLRQIHLLRSDQVSLKKLLLSVQINVYRLFRSCKSFQGNFQRH